MRVTAVAFGLAVFVASVVYGGPPGGVWQWVVLALGAVATAGLTVIAVLADRRYRREHREFQVTVFDTLAPFVHALNLMAAESVTARKRSLAGALMAGLAAATGLADADRARATIFERRVRGEGEVLSPGPSMGQGDKPRSVFARGTPAGDEVWAAVDTDTTRFCRDVLRYPPAGWASDGPRSYQTFITVPIRTGDRVHGILTLNAPNPGDLTDEDVGVMLVIASLLGAAYALAAPVPARRT
jgi:GAF domain-containing protein